MNNEQGKQTQESDAWLPNTVNGLDSSKRSTMGGRKGKTKLEKILLCSFPFTILVILVLIILLAAGVNQKEKIITVSEKSTVCTSIDCVTTAARIESCLDRTVDPCDDFYQFSCGGWLKKNIIPTDKPFVSSFSTLSDQMSIKLKILLEAKNSAQDLESVKKARDLYASCLNTDEMTQRGDKPLKKLLQSLGGWPLLSRNWDDVNFDLVSTLVALNKQGETPIINLYVSVNHRKSTQRILSIDQPSFGMPGQKYYLVDEGDKFLEAYKVLIRKLVGLLGGVGNVQADVDDLVQFEVDLAKISVPDEERRDNVRLYNPMTLGDIHNRYNQGFDWKRYINTITELPEIGLSDVNETEIIINRSPEYFDNLTALLIATPKRVLSNYMLWRSVLNLIGTQGEIFKPVLNDYKKSLFGVSTEPPRFKLCALYTTTFMPLAVGRLFIQKHFNADSKIVALEMIDGLHASFNELLQDLDWMDDKTRKLAMDKNNHIKPRIGYPHQVLNDSYLDHYYSNHTYDRLSYFENVMTNKRLSFINNIRRLREPIDKEKWESAPSEVNAYYSPTTNQILFPAGILQPPFFSRTNPRSTVRQRR